jgi:ubiquinone/menaquinone biosynthesis C-methylase UbiE
MDSSFDKAYEKMWNKDESARKSSPGINPRWKIVSRMADYEGKKLLDCGCGDGWLIEKIKGPSLKCGIDVSGNALKRCGGFYRVKGSATSLPVKGGSFDIAVSSLVLEYLEDDVRALKEMNRCLVGGGKAILLVTINPKLWGTDDDFPKAYRRYAEGEIEIKACAAGFKILQKKYWGFPFFRIYRSLSLRGAKKSKATGMEAAGMIKKFRLAPAARVLNGIDSVFSGKPWGTEGVFLLEKTTDAK